jgi:hypothetical protein
MTQNKMKLIATVMVPNGKPVRCTVEHTVPNLFALMPDLHVRATEGRPFDGQREIIVNANRAHLSMEKQS